MAYIGQGIKQGTFKVLDTSGNTYNGSNTTFSLGTQVGSAAQLLVSHDGVIQLPGTDYTLASGGASITFSTAPASGASIFIVEISGAVGGTVTPSDNSVTADKFNSALLTGHTDIGANLADADLFLVDDGAGGTLRKVAASRIKTYAGGAALANDGDNRVVTADGSGGLNGEANLTFNGSNLDLSDGNITNVGTVAADRVKGDADSDSYIDFPGSDIVTINTGDNIRFRIDDSGKLSSGGETSPDVTKGGITLNQVQFDDAAFTIKSSDVSHGFTSFAEADTYFSIGKVTGDRGGVKMTCVIEGDTAEQSLTLRGLYNGTNQSTERSNGSTGLLNFVAAKNDGSNNTADLGSNGNCMTFRNNNTTLAIIDADGDILANNSNGTFDEFEDAQMVRALDLSHGRGVIESKFDKFVKYNSAKLIELDLIGQDSDGSPNNFVNVTGLQRLHNGAIWQQYEKHNQLLEAVYDLAKEAVGEEKANAILEKHEVKRLQ